MNKGVSMSVTGKKIMDRPAELGDVVKGKRLE